MSEIAFALGRLVPRLEGGDAEWTPRDVEVYRFFLAAKVEELKGLAKESTMTMSPTRCSPSVRPLVRRAVSSSKASD